MILGISNTLPCNGNKYNLTNTYFTGKDSIIKAAVQKVETNPTESQMRNKAGSKTNPLGKLFANCKKFIKELFKKPEQDTINELDVNSQAVEDTSEEVFPTLWDELDWEITKHSLPF